MHPGQETLARLAPGFAATRADLSLARHLPGELYCSPEIYALEKARIWMTHWLSVGRVEELPNVGDYKTLRITDESIVVTRSGAEEFSVFMNQCLHRGAELAAGCGHVKDFSCPYHAWLYGVDGRLIAAPGMKACKVDLSGARLRPLQQRIWRGWIFVNFSDSPPPFEDFIAPFETHLWWFRTEQCRTASTVVMNVKCNWKFLVENLIDIYHVGVIHASSFGGFVKSSGGLQFQLERGGGWHVRYEARPHDKSGRQVFPTLPWAEQESSSIACKAGIYPNLNLSMRADSVRMWHVWPRSVAETQIVCYLLFPQAAFGIPDFDSELERYRAFVAQIVTEDSAMVESLQRSATSGFFRPGPMSPLEEALYHMENHYLDVMQA
ncbi:MAG TPA: aromatic ring-hydroxylating dioxygenase subunit alpha [Steroidobacteraceae bacterium]|nr:aromatic ring-hydroxylating dioxygenase subunit alpha [Steroidobacteraceae bacterium]